MIAIVAIAGFLIFPIMGAALAGDDQCKTGGNGGPPCCNNSGCTTNDNFNGTCQNGACVATPEMSDYLAMAFVLVTSGMIYYFRRRAFVKA
jgi:hypothetical protein